MAKLRVSTSNCLEVSGAHCKKIILQARSYIVFAWSGLTLEARVVVVCRGHFRPRSSEDLGAKKCG